MDIKTALQHLDMANDDLWTDDGLPRVGAVKELTGDTSITRAQITAADPTFTRNVGGESLDSSGSDSTTDAETDAGDQGADPEPTADESGSQDEEQADADDADSGGGADTDSGLDQGDGDQPEPEDTRHPEEIRAAKITEIDNMVSELQNEQDQITAQIDSLTATRHALHRQNEPGHGRKSDMLARMAVIKSQNEIRAAKHANRAAILKHLDVKSVDPRSPLDQAMQRKTGRGTDRPGSTHPNA